MQWNRFSFFQVIDENLDLVRISRAPSIESLKTLLEPLYMYNSETQLEHNDAPSLNSNSSYEQTLGELDECQISENTHHPTGIISGPECDLNAQPTPFSIYRHSTATPLDSEGATITHLPSDKPVFESDNSGYVSEKGRVSLPAIEDQGVTQGMVETGNEELSLVETSSSTSSLSSLGIFSAPEYDSSAHPTPYNGNDSIYQYGTATPIEKAPITHLPSEKPVFESDNSGYVCEKGRVSLPTIEDQGFTQGMVENW